MERQCSSFRDAFSQSAVGSADILHDVQPADNYYVALGVHIMTQSVMNLTIN